VGVTTLYLRFTSKEALIEQVLLERFVVVEDAGSRTLEDPSVVGFLRVRPHPRRDGHREPGTVRVARIGASPGSGGRPAACPLHDRAAHRTGSARRRRTPGYRLGKHRFLPKSVLTSPRCLGLIAGERSWERILTVLLGGLRTPAPSPPPAPGQATAGSPSARLCIALRVPGRRAAAALDRGRCRRAQERLTTEASQYFNRHAVGGGHGSWIVWFHRARLLARDQAIMAHGAR
jgi:AcrR family transcriptional regulator